MQLLIEDGDEFEGWAEGEEQKFDRQNMAVRANAEIFEPGHQNPMRVNGRKDSRDRRFTARGFKAAVVID